MGRRVGAITRFKREVRRLKRERAKAAPQFASPPPNPVTGRYWWQEKEEPDMPAIEPPRPAPYDGEPFKVTAEGLDGVRRLWAWTRKPEQDALAQHGPAIRAAGMHAFYEHVRNRKTGDG